MQVSVFASGSSGNCLLLSGCGSSLLIDAGISMRRVSEGLAATGHIWQDIGGVLITHEHSDHISALAMILKYHPMPVYAPHTVANRLFGMLPGIEGCLRIIPVGERFAVGSLSVTAFHTPHDTQESVGYRVQGDGVFAHATDMGHVSEEVLDGLLGADTALIEANHDEQMLRYGPYPVYLKRRILSDRGHLSNADCALLAERLAASGTRRIILGHLSKENNRPELALQTVRAALTGRDTEVYCAPAGGCLTIAVERGGLC